MNTHSQPSQKKAVGFPRQRYTNKSILIIETTGCLAIPLTYFPTAYKIYSAISLHEVKSTLEQHEIDLVVFNVSCPEETMFEILQTVYHYCSEDIIPILLVIDLSTPVTSIPGTTWGDKLGILHTLSSRGEFIATMQRLFGEL